MRLVSQLGVRTDGDESTVLSMALANRSVPQSGETARRPYVRRDIGPRWYGRTKTTEESFARSNRRSAGLEELAFGGAVLKDSTASNAPVL